MGHVKTVTREHHPVHCSIELEVAPSIRILHIEDDGTIAAIATEIFEEQGWQVQTCDDGNAAIEHIAGEVRYDFLLFDYDLPRINGLELVQRARKLVHRSRTPVGVLSATPVRGRGTRGWSGCFLAEAGRYWIACGNYQ
jgi:CheY-like chemotaxis protein